MTRSDPPRPRLATTLTIRVWSAGGNTNRVFVYFDERELAVAGLRIGDDLVLEVRGAVIRGVVSKDKAGVWLGTRALQGEWSHQRITEALRSVGIANPAKASAWVVACNGVARATADAEELRRASRALRGAGVVAGEPAGCRAPARVERVVQVFERDPGVVAFVLDAAGGCCELCGEAAPFLREDGEPFLEMHHVVPLAEGGSDTVGNAVALCPNCHRRVHHAGVEERVRAREWLAGRVGRLACPAPA